MHRCLWLLLLLIIAPAAFAQELDPRRWAHLPVDTNFLGGGYAYTQGDIAFDPVLRIEGAEMEVHTLALRYIRSFELLGRSARVDLSTGYQEGRWSGLLNGAPASVHRQGMTDSVVRFAVNLYGAPPLKGREYATYRASTEPRTIVGAALAVVLPTGRYLKDKLINLGSNRYVLRPQVGVTHERGRWLLEMSGSAWLYTDNDSFYNGNRLENEPLYTVQGHVTYNFRPGLWASAGMGYGYGAESTLNGVAKDDRKENLGWTLGFGYPLSRKLGLSLRYIGFRTQNSLGTDSDTIVGSISTFW